MNGCKCSDWIRLVKNGFARRGAAANRDYWVIELKCAVYKPIIKFCPFCGSELTAPEDSDAGKP